MYFVYILRCADNSLYTGITNDLTARMAAHQAGKGSKYVRSRLPFTLVYREELQTKSQALKREMEIKAMDKVEKEKLMKL